MVSFHQSSRYTKRKYPAMIKTKLQFKCINFQRIQRYYEFNSEFQIAIKCNNLQKLRVVPFGVPS